MSETQTSDNGSHPDLDRWIAYRAGDLESEEETLQDHLASCRSCTALVLDLESFADPTAAEAAATAAVSDFEKAAVWRGLQPRLRRRPSSTGRPAIRRWVVPTTLAASLLAAVLGGGLWLQQRELTDLRGQLAELSRPQANAPVYDLFPRTVRRGESGPEPLEIPAAAPTFTVILNRVGPAELGTCRAEIVDSQNRSVVVIDGLELDESGVFTFMLVRGSLAAGDYVVRLWATDGDPGTPIEEYPLRIVYREAR